MKGKWATLLVAGLLACGLFWSQTRREKLVLQTWCQENGLHITAVHMGWDWNGFRFRRGRKGSVYRFEAVRDGETAGHVYWALITLWHGTMEVAVETPAHDYVRVGTGSFPNTVF